MPPESVKELFANLEGKHVCIAVPSYSCTVATNFAQSYGGSCVWLHQLGAQMSFIGMNGSVYIDDARDKIVYTFLNETDADILITIDSDVSWNPPDMMRVLCHLDYVDMCCAMYPLKKDPLDFKLKLWLDDVGRLVVKNGLIRAYGVPAGFLAMKRSALEKMVKAYPEMSYNAESPHSFQKNHTQVDFGNNHWQGGKITALHNMFIEDGHYYREDIAFGMRWSKVGDGIWVDPDIELTHHHGIRGYTGNFGRWLYSQGRDKGTGSGIGEKDAREMEAVSFAPRQARVSEPDSVGHQSGAQP